MANKPNTPYFSLTSKDAKIYLTEIKRFNKSSHLQITITTSDNKEATITLDENQVDELRRKIIY